MTTRPLCDGETNGKEYYFITMEEMNNLDAQNKLVERRDYNTMKGIWSYATSSEIIYLDKFNYLTTNTWSAYGKFINFYRTENLVPIYFELDKGIRLERALNREKKSKSSDYAEMCRRFLSDEQDFTKELVDFYKPYIVDNNGSVENSMEQIEDILIHKLKIEKK